MSEPTDETAPFRPFKWASELRSDAADGRSPESKAATAGDPFAPADSFATADFGPTMKQFEDYGWPPALVKATADPFEYTAGVTGLGTLMFESAEYVSPQWVRLVNARFFSAGKPAYGSPSLCNHWQRGVEVRVSAIKWVADGGH